MEAKQANKIQWQMTSEDNGETWVFEKMHDGHAVVTVDPVDRCRASVYAAGIINFLQPPRAILAEELKGLTIR